MTSPRATPPSAEQVRQALDGVQDPEIHRPITELGMVENIDIAADGAVLVEVWLTVAGCPLREKITRDVTAAVGKVPGVSAVRVELDVMSDEQRRGLQTQLRGGKPEPEIPFAQPSSLTRVYAVASGRSFCCRSTMSIQPIHCSSPSRVQRPGSFFQKRSTLLLAFQSAAAASTAPRRSEETANR